MRYGKLGSVPKMTAFNDPFDEDAAPTWPGELSCSVRSEIKQ